MVPFQEMDQQDTQRAFELVELFAPQRLDLLGNVLAVNRVELAGAEETLLPLRPRVEVAIVAGADRFVGGREANLVSANATSHGCPLSHTFIRLLATACEGAVHARARFTPAPRTGPPPASRPPCRKRR